MIAPAPLHIPPQMPVVNGDAEPTDAWIAAVARMLLADVDRERDQEGAEEPVETWN